MAKSILKTTLETAKIVKKSLSRSSKEVKSVTTAKTTSGIKGLNYFQKRRYNKWIRQRISIIRARNKAEIDSLKKMLQK